MKHQLQLVLIEAHSDLEKMVHTKHQNKFKSIIDDEWAYLVYSGLWQDPLKTDLDGFIEASQKPVSGTVKLKDVQRKSKSSWKKVQELSLQS